MPTLRFSRQAPLTADEVASLPSLATLSAPGTDERFVITLDLPLPDLLRWVYDLGAAVPGCALAVDAPEVADAPPAGTDPWKLAAAGDARAEGMLTGQPLDATGRFRVQEMWASGDPKVVALGCRIARVTGWKSAVQGMRRLLTHPSPLVRTEVVLGMGELAGPSLTMAVRPLLTDSDEGVRVVAKKVLAGWGD